VGKGSKVRWSENIRSSEESPNKQGVLTDEREAKRRPHPYEYSCGVYDHVNEYDENLNTSTIKEVDQRSILIIGGIQIFLPIIPIEASAQVSYVAERQPAVTVIEEKEKILNSTPIEEEENSDDMLTPWDIELKFLEDWLNNTEP
jgi:hypothetical protein